MSEPVHGDIEFFNPSCPFSFTGWDFQNEGGRKNSLDYSNELGSGGNELRHATHNGKASNSWTFVSSLESGNLSIPSAGAVPGGWHIDQVEIKWDRAQIKPKMTVSAHLHTAGRGHGSGTGNNVNLCRTYSPTITVGAVAFGVPADLGAVSLSTGAVVDFRDATYTLSVNHIDETGRDGNELAGDNYDGTETLAVNFTGRITPDDVEIEDGWTKTGDGETPSNTGATTADITLVKHIANDVSDD